LKNILITILILTSSLSFGQNLADLYEKVSSSVVVVYVVSLSNETAGNQVVQVENEATGSGVLISQQGLIWTAAHVVQTAEVVGVEFLDGDFYEADVITSNQQADVALLKIKGDFELKQKHIAKVGDSDKVRTGSDLFVLGAPHGFKQSLSRGILSGRLEPESLSNNFVKIEYLQTDAAINPGNSGGPVFNMDGEVIGIASSIFTQSGGFEGIGFAISSNLTKEVLMDEPGLWTGIESRIVSGTLAKALNVPQESGLLVLSVSSQGVGSKLGLRGGFIPANIDGVEILIGGDIILNIAGIEIEDNNSLFMIRNTLKTAPKGTVFTISILRNGQVGTAEFNKL
jgi:serine protease Do